jgi:uncharacterized cupin superfamily protein
LVFIVDIRRVVTGHDPNGQAVVVSDGPAPRSHDFRHVPGMSSTLVWATAAAQPAGAADPTPGLASQLPGPGGTCFVIVRFPPDEVLAGADPVAAAAEHLTASPGIAERFEPGTPGMHVTDSVDYVLVLDGTIWLDLDDGEPIRLGPGDTVIQNATRHAWRNLGDAPATLAVVHVGVTG